MDVALFGIMNSVMPIIMVIAPPLVGFIERTAW